MSLYEFKRNDFFHNVLKTHPRTHFFLYGGKTFYNESIELSGNFHGEVAHKSAGQLSLYEMNIDRHSDKLIYPFVIKDGSRTGFSTISVSDYNSNFAFGDQLTGTYPLTSSISFNSYAAGTARLRLSALKNSLKRYTPQGQHYFYSSSTRDLSSAEVNLCSSPRIFFGSGIKKGSVVLRYHLTGNILAEARDEKQDGALYQVLPTTVALGSGSIVGTVMYNEGFLILTGTTDLSNSQYSEDYANDTVLVSPKWTSFGKHEVSNLTSSYVLEFSGTTRTNVLTMMAHAKSGDLDFSNNPTFLDFTSSISMTTGVGDRRYYSEKQRSVKNVVSSSYHNQEETYEKTVYISKIGIYDEEKNLIAIAKTSKPIRKKVNDEYTFKLKLDI
jgi:hypothetical protein